MFVRFLIVTLILLSSRLLGDVTATELSRIYSINRAKADSIYKDKKLTVFGRVSQVISTSRSILILLRGYGQLQLQCVFPKSDAIKLALLKSGDDIALEGQCQGRIAETIYFIDCKKVDTRVSGAISGVSEKPKLSADDLAKCRKSIVIIEGKKGAGTGFFCKLSNGTTAIVTNAHMIWDNPNIKLLNNNGIVIKPKGCYFAPDRDLAFITVANPDKYTPLEFDPKCGELWDNTPVCVLGNSLGDGVTTEIYGVITAIGPEKVETSARFVSGNSGSPIISLKNGRVVGVATYSKFARASSIDDVHYNGIRRFGCRIDNCDLKKLQRYTSIKLKQDIKMEKELKENIEKLATLIRILQYQPPVKRYLVTTISSSTDRRLRVEENVNEYVVTNRGGVWSQRSKKRIDYTDKNKSGLKIFDRKLDRNLEDVPGMKDFVRKWNNQFVTNTRFYSDKETNHLVNYTAYYNLLKSAVRDLDKFNSKYKNYRFSYSKLKKDNSLQYQKFQQLREEFDSEFDNFEVK